MVLNDISEPPRSDDLEEELRRKLQRDINCLFDPDRNARRRSLAKIKKQLIEEPGATPAHVLCGLFSKHLKKALLQLITDPVEKCREMSLSMLLAFVTPPSPTKPPVLGPAEVGALTTELVPVVKSRVGVAPFAEPTEEIRLQLLQLLNVVLTSEAGWKAVEEGKLTADIAMIIAREALDSFPDVKREVCGTVALLAAKVPRDLRLHQASLLQSLLTNLGHQHSKVRQATLQAVGQLLSCGNDAMARVLSESVLPALRKLVFDRTPAIRRELSVVVAAWITGDDDVARHFKGSEADLVLLVMTGLSDEVDEAREASRQQLHDMGRAWSRRADAEAEAESDIPVDSVKKDRAKEGQEGGKEGKEGMVRMTRALLGPLVSKVLDDVAHWTLRLRHRALLTLSHLVGYAGEDMVSLLPSVVAVLANATFDEEAEVQRAVEECGKALGAAVDPQALLEVMLPGVSGRKAGQSTAQHRSSALLLLRSLLQGMGPLTGPQVEAVSEAMVDDGILDCQGMLAEVGQLADAYSLCVETLVTLAPREHVTVPSVRGRLVRVLIQGLAVPEGFGDAQGVRDTARAALAKLAEASGMDVEALLSTHFAEVVKGLREGPEGQGVWAKDSPRRMALEALVREAHVGTAKHLGLLVPLFTLHLQPESDPEVRLVMMALLESVLSDEACRDHLPGQSRAIILDMIVPNAVWRAGRVACTIRKLSLVCLYSLLRQARVPLPVLYETVPPLLPILKTDLDDYDASSRHLVCLSLQAIFAALPGALDEEPVRQLYPELLKRLDDSSDQVRVSVCATLCAFLGAASPDVFRAGILDYMLDQLFVHLDDQDAGIQEAVLKVLKVATPIDRPLMLKKATAARGSHRSPRFCDELLKDAA